MLSQTPLSQRLAHQLGYAGLVPFYLLAGLHWSDRLMLQQLASQGFLLYAAMILAFLSGTLWGSAKDLDETQKPIRLLFSNALVVAGFMALLIAPPVLAGAILLLCHAILLQFEIRHAKKNGWYLRLRLKLTALSGPSYLIWAAAMYTGSVQISAAVT